MTLDFAGTTGCAVSQKTSTVSRLKNLSLGVFLLLITGIITSCAGVSSGGLSSGGSSSGETGTSATSRSLTISIYPTGATVPSSCVKQFKATVSNSSNTAVTWTASAGTISNTGVFTAPAVTDSTRVSVTATSAADFSKQASATVMVNPYSPAAVSISIYPTTASVSSRLTCRGMRPTTCSTRTSSRRSCAVKRAAWRSRP